MHWSVSGAMRASGDLMAGRDVSVLVRLTYRSVHQVKLNTYSAQSDPGESTPEHRHTDTQAALSRRVILMEVGVLTEGQGRDGRAG